MLITLFIALVACVVATLWWRRRTRTASSDDVLSNSDVPRALTDFPTKPSVRVRLDDASWVDVFSCLDRPSLDCVERITRRFHRIVTSNLGDKCFRRLVKVTLGREHADFHVNFTETETRPSYKGGRCDWFRDFRRFHDFNEAVDFLFSVVRGTATGMLRLQEITITKYFVEKLHEVSRSVSIRKELMLFDVHSTPEMFRSLFAVPFVNVAQLGVKRCALLASHIGDALLVALAKANVKSANFSLVAQPVDATSYNVTEDAILDFLFRDEFNGTDAGDRELVLGNVAVTQNFFKRLVEQNFASRLTSRLTLKIDRCVAQATTLYAAQRTSTDTIDRYEFKAAVRFQLVVFRNALEMRRGTDPEDGSPFFI